MADLRSRFIEDYAGGLLNVSRQELSSSGEVASQDGLPTDGGTLFVEDGTGTKSGLRLGVSLAEVMDPTTEMGCVNVRFGDRTYAKLKDLKLFTTAIASAQAALSEACSTSITNLETTLQLLETDISALQQSIQSDIYDSRNKIEDLKASYKELDTKITTVERDNVDLTVSINSSKADIQSIKNQFAQLSSTVQYNNQTTISAISALSNSLNEFKNETRSAITALDARVSALGG